MTNDFTYRFIQALDEGEIRFCRDRLARDNSAVKRGQLALFNALSGMQEYDLPKLKKELQGLAVVRHIAVEKIRLYEKLFLSVRILRDRRKNASDPKLRLEEAEILFEMGMLPEAAEVAQKGLDYAVRHQELFFEIPLRNLLRKVHKNIASKELVATRTQNEYELVTAGRKLATLLRYVQISDRMFDYLRNYRVSDSDSVKRGIEELMNTPEMKDANKADSLPSQISYYSILELYEHQRNNVDRAIEYGNRVISLWEQDPERIRSDPNVYRAQLASQIGKLSTNNRFDEAFVLLQRLEQMNVESRRNEILLFTYVELQFQLLYLNQGRLKEVLEREQRVSTGLRRFQKGMVQSSRLAILYNLGITHVFAGDQKKAMRYFDRITDLGVLSIRRDIQGAARLWRLLLHIDHEDLSSFNHYLRNSRQFFSQKDRGYALEVGVHQWLHEHRNVVGTVEKKESFGELATMTKVFAESRLLASEDIFIWASAKKRGILASQRLELMIAGDTEV